MLPQQPALQTLVFWGLWALILMCQMETASTEGIRPPLRQAFPPKSTQSLHAQGTEHAQGLLQNKGSLNWNNCSYTQCPYFTRQHRPHGEETENRSQKPLFLLLDCQLALSMALLRHSPRAAAVQCAIMKPEFRPPSVTKNAGSSLSEGLQSLSILLSLIAASSCTPIAK